MVALLDYIAVFHKQNIVGVAYRTQKNLNFLNGNNYV